MRVLLDECLPKRLKRELAGHLANTVPEMGWSGKKNGELLGLMAANGFEVLLTSDQNLRYQQNLQANSIAMIVMVAVSNKVSDLLPLMAQIQMILSVIQPGELVEVG